MPTMRAHLRPGSAPLLLVLVLVVPLMLAPDSSIARQATPAATPLASADLGALPPAWLEFGPRGELIARVIADGSCPAIAFDGRSSEMRQRTVPSPEFPVIACEATIPFGVATALIGDQALPVPSGPLNRIAVMGDTGCRLNDWEKKYQACNDPHAWPFAEVAAAVAAWEPDLIIHVGDYLYRESPCPATGVDCTGSPHGDNWATWNADFFAPASVALGSAPWVFMRGNHETCDRNPEGWFHFLDPGPYQSACQTFTAPYVAPLNGPTLAVIDSAEAADTNDTPEEAAEYTQVFKELGEMAPEGAWLVTHRPVWGILEGQHGEFEVENATYAASTNDALGGNYGLVLSGHIHLAEVMAFEDGSSRPPQIIAGNSGTALDDIPTASPTAGQLGDPTIAEAETLSAFGFMTLEPDGQLWIATQRDASGAPLVECVLALPEIECGSALESAARGDLSAAPR